MGASVRYEKYSLYRRSLPSVDSVQDKNVRLDGKKTVGQTFLCSYDICDSLTALERHRIFEQMSTLH